MSVYVDNYRASYGRMIMCHMLADDESELHAMADKIGIDRKHFQNSSNNRKKHYDICLAKKRLAIKNGAIEITLRQLGRFIRYGSINVIPPETKK